MFQTKKQSEKVVLNRKYVENLQKKASFLEDFLSFVEDKYLGDLMEKTEKEENISLSEAEKVLK